MGIKEKIHDVALVLREEISKTEESQLPDNLKIEDIQKGEVDIPELKELFFRISEVGQIPDVGQAI